MDCSPQGDIDTSGYKQYTVLDPVVISAPPASLLIGDQNSNPWSPFLDQNQNLSYWSWLYSYSLC